MRINCICFYGQVKTRLLLVSLTGKATPIFAALNQWEKKKKKKPVSCFSDKTTKLWEVFPFRFSVNVPPDTHKAQLSNGMMMLMFNTCAFRAANKGPSLPYLHTCWMGWVPLTSAALGGSYQDRSAKACSSKGAGGGQTKKCSLWRGWM